MDKLGNGDPEPEDQCSAFESTTDVKSASRERFAFIIKFERQELL